MEIVTRKEAKESGLSRYFTGKACKYGHVSERNVGNKNCLECSKSRENSPEHKDKVKKYREENKEARKESSRRYREDNKEYLKLRKKEYYEKNKETILEKSREDYKINPNKYKEKNKKSYLNNREARQESNKKYRDENKDQIRQYAQNYYLENKGDIIEKVLQWQRENKEKHYLKCSLWRKQNKGKCNAKAVRRRSAKLQRTLNLVGEIGSQNTDNIKGVYQKASDLQATFDEVFHVDHIVPLRGEKVSGLHVWYNLQILTQSENDSKGNSFTPYTVNHITGETLEVVDGH